VNPVLSISNLSVGYGHVSVLENISIAIRDGSITALVGSNGAGKTTLLRTVSGLLKPTSGTIEFQGADIAGVHPKLVVNKGLLHVPEGRGLFRGQTVKANLDLGLYGADCSRAVEAERYERVFEIFPVLKERLSSVAGVLSGGQQQMLSIGQALMRAPKLLMLDEPSLGLAPIIVDQVLDAVQRLQKAGTTILLVEQMVERALEISDYGYVLQNGRLVGQGTPQQLVDGDMIRMAYLGVGTAHSL
jgi:branched-chain amino acid transport system ATP-binding protein